jgi:hypothetical protein
MKILLGCEESQAVCIEFRKRGFEAYSCDILPESGGYPQWHIQDDLLKVIQREHWDAMIAFPPCTYLTVSANKWFKDQPQRKSGALVGAERRKAREDAIYFFMQLANAPIEYKGLENPIGIMSTEFRRPDQVIQPWQFGHGETKATCLWLFNLPLLKPTNVVDGREQRLHRLPKTKDRAMLRSKTYPGIAAAMAEQWGNYLLNPVKQGVLF